MTPEQTKEIGQHINSVFQYIYSDCEGYDIEDMWESVLDLLYDRAEFSSLELRKLFLEIPDEELRKHFWQNFQSEYSYYFG